MSNEISVYLVLSGFKNDPDEITAAMGLLPEEIWREGDPIGRTIRLREESGWKLSSGMDKSTDLNEQIEALLNRLELVAPILSELGQTCYMEIACVLRAYDFVPAMHLERSTVQRIARIGAEIDIDFYCLLENEQYD